MQCNAIGQDLIELMSSRFVGHAHHGRDTCPHDRGRLYLLHIYLFVNQLKCGLVKNEFQPTNSGLLCLYKTSPSCWRACSMVDVVLMEMALSYDKGAQLSLWSHGHVRTRVCAFALAFVFALTFVFALRIAVDSSKLRIAVAACNLQGQRVPYLFLILRCESLRPSFWASNKR